MGGRVVLDSKKVEETSVVTFDFTSRLNVGATISTQVVTSEVYSGVDASPSAMISGSASASGTVVTQLITGGVLGVLYLLECVITTSDGQTLSLNGFLAVAPDIT
jgi:hypothetical protein